MLYDELYQRYSLAQKYPLRINTEYFEEFTNSIIKAVTVENDVKEKEQPIPTCKECDIDCSNVEGAIDHLVAVVNDESFVRPEVTSKERCPVCTRQLAVRESSMRNHLKIHLKEAHGNTTLCQICQMNLGSVAKFFDHQKEHYRLVFSPAKQIENQIL